ncbi:hypothetical protein THASP1DRAFT_13409, partial [Thamnocephalis sphaerospora]
RRKRVQWYLSRGLARRIEPPSLEGNDDSSLDDVAGGLPIVIQLTFTARGDGRAGNAFYLEDRRDACVCCNRQQQLTMHHVVPDLYRQHMPLSVKSRSSYDVLPLCIQCHDGYERHAYRLKEAIAAQYGVPLVGRGWVQCREDGHARRAACALLRNAAVIPEARRAELATTVRRWWMASNEHQEESASSAVANGQLHEGIPQRVLERASQLEDRVRGPDFVEHGPYVVAQLLLRQCSDDLPDDAASECLDKDDRQNHVRWPDLEAFVQQWRQHFLDHAKPAHLSPHWRVNGTIYTGDQR